MFVSINVLEGAKCSGVTRIFNGGGVDRPVIRGHNRLILVNIHEFVISFGEHQGGEPSGRVKCPNAPSSYATAYIRTNLQCSTCLFAIYQLYSVAT